MMEKKEDIDFKKMTEVFGPGVVDRELRQTMHMCWMSLPPERKTIDDLEREMQRLLARAIKDWREDERVQKPG